MPSTTNFNWTTPADTDLVKDGAAAIRTLANGIDTSFVDLKGGTTGQVLAKASGTDLDFSWVAQDDSNAIQNAIVDAKGDLIAATAADTPARLPVGTNGQILTADSAEATGLKWVTPGGGAGLTLIDEIAVTSSSSTNVNDVFSSTYKNYKIMLVAASTGASPAEVTMRLRVSGTDTTANYAAQEIYSFSTTLAGRSNLFGTDEWYLGDLGTSTTGGVVSFDLTSPNLADRTSFVCNSANGGSTLKITGGAQTDTTQFTGFTLNYAQTTTGSIFVYGYAKE